MGVVLVSKQRARTSISGVRYMPTPFLTIWIVGISTAKGER